MILAADGWRDYELLDSGEGMKLERWGQYVMARPDSRIIWSKGNPELWKKADAIFENEKWKFRTDPPQGWMISFGKFKFQLKPTEFKHTGVFPEQAVNWKWISEQRADKVLNLFAYTGGATMAAALISNQVTHVDSSKPSLMWAGENAKLSGITNVRWIQDDALKFVQREVRRGVKYDGIIMDPPRFGRGNSGEVWKLEENITKLVWACKEIMSASPKFFLINAYTSDLSNVALGNLLTDVMGNGVENGEIGLQETSRERILPAGVFVRWKS